MPASSVRQHHTAGGDPPRPSRAARSGLPLFWRICLINGLVFTAGTAALVISPATVSATPVLTEAVVLAVGLSVILIANAALVRAALSPLERLSRLMAEVDLLRPGQRLPEAGNGAVAGVIHSFNAMLTRLEAERSTSAARALAAQETERHRVAQELHDEIGQRLTAVLLGLKRAVDRAPQDLQPELALVLEDARSCLDEIRKVASRLRPGVLEDLGLLSALSALTTEFDRVATARVHRRLDPHLPGLRAGAELVVYRVAQEALTNAARHSAATEVQVELVPYGVGAVMLRVADDGTGLRGRPEGAGLRGMRERALLIGADLTIGPRPGGGTEVRLIVPVHGAPERV